MGFPKGLVHNLLMRFFTLGSSKTEVSETYFFAKGENLHKQVVHQSLGEPHSPLHSIPK